METICKHYDEQVAVNIYIHKSWLDIKMRFMSTQESSIIFNTINTQNIYLDECIEL